LHTGWSWQEVLVQDGGAVVLQPEPVQVIVQLLPVQVEGVVQPEPVQVIVQLLPLQVEVVLQPEPVQVIVQLLPVQVTQLEPSQLVGWPVP